MTGKNTRSWHWTLQCRSYLRSVQMHSRKLANNIVLGSNRGAAAASLVSELSIRFRHVCVVCNQRRARRCPRHQDARHDVGVIEVLYHARTSALSWFSTKFHRTAVIYAPRVYTIHEAARMCPQNCTSGGSGVFIGGGALGWRHFHLGGAHN